MVWYEVKVTKEHEAVDETTNNHERLAKPKADQLVMDFVVGCCRGV
jgi:hypothetical protein